MCRIYTRSGQTTVHHTVLSWRDKDREQVTPQTFKDITKKYSKLRGENDVCVAAIHTDKNHIYLHIAMSGVQMNGLSGRISQQEFAQSDCIDHPDSGLDKKVIFK